MPRQPPKFPVVIAPSYLRELRARVVALGIVAVARAGGMSRHTAWRALTGGQGRRPNADAIERIRRAVGKLEPDRPPPPPAIVSIRGANHAGWVALADKLDEDELARAVASPARILAAAKRRKRPAR